MLRLKLVLLTVAAVGLLLLLVVTASDSEAVRNESSAGLYWSTEKDGADLDTSSDGGFSSLDGMLHWAIGSSDPTKLKETAEDVKLLSPEELKQRQAEIKELLETLKMPSDAQLLQIAIDDLNNSTLSLDDHLRALQQLLILVEPIDNANDMQKLGGFTVVIRSLNHPDPQIRTSSAWVLGKACQNNQVVQKQLLQHGTLTKLMKMVRSDFAEEAIKALYAVSALIRNNLEGQELFYREAGELMLQEILSNSGIDIRLRRKAVFLVSDLVECELENENKLEPPYFSNQFLWKAVVDLLSSADLDLQEKALYAIKNLLLLRSTEALVFKEFCELDEALEKLGQQLQLLLTEESHGEYASDIESLRREVLQIFLENLDNKVRKEL